MGTTLSNGVYLPDEGERNCYAGLKVNWEILNQKVADIRALQLAIAGALHREIVESLPTTDIDPNTIYMVLSGTSATENVYNEFMYVNNAWELIGTSATDLTNYYTKSEVDGKLLLKASASDLTSHTGDTTIHVTASDKTKWTNSANTVVLRLAKTALTPSSSTNAFSNLDDATALKVGDKVMDTAGVLFEVTAIDSQNSTFTIGTSLIDLARDSDVVHKSGNESITGTKTFGNGTLTVDNNNIGSNVHGEIKLDGSRPGYIVADNASDGVFDSSGCGVSILLQDKAKPLHVGTYKVDANGRVFVDNTNKNPVLSITGSLVKSSVLAPENETVNPMFRILSELNYANGNPSKTLDVRFLQYDNADATSVIYSNADNKTALGSSTKRWNKVYANEYYYGSNNVEFSTKFVTTDTAQTISGAKTFSDTLTIYNNDSSQATKNLTISSSKIQVGDTSNSDSFGIVFNAGLSYVSRIMAFKDASGTQNLQLNVRTKDSSNNFIVSMIRLRLFANGFSTFESDGNNLVSLGSSSNKWKDVNTYLVNGLEPSSLSLPSGNANDVIDISSYLTYLDGTDNTYVAPSNGWITINMNNCSGIHATIAGFWSDSRVRASAGAIKFLMPVLKNQTVVITIHGGTINNARFIPCQGNV